MTVRSVAWRLRTSPPRRSREAGAASRSPLPQERDRLASVSPPSEPGANRALDVPVSGYVPADLTGDSLRAALEAAATWLELQAASINALNVYPVPDGDTGTNMSMTMRAAAEASAVEPSGEAHAVARAAARGALMGARGNSGVIL